MSKEPILSILIPNRQSVPFIFETIDNILSCKDNRFEIIVNDNSFPNKLDFSSYTDKRIKIFIEPTVLSMTQNFYNVLVKAKGKYITYIGSDDGCIPKNLSTLIDFLEKSNVNAVNTRHLFFNNERTNFFFTVPKKPVTLNKYIYIYPNKLSFFFYSYRTWLPMPYALAAVKRELLFEIINKYDQIPGIAPDDFLGHFIAQKIRKGVFFDLPVFITCNSNRSNASALQSEKNTDISNQFIKDSLPKLGELTKIFGLNCLPSITVEHYYLARDMKIRNFNLIKYWVIFSCFDCRHHDGRVFKLTIGIRRIIFTACDNIFKYFFMLLNFSIFKPSRPIKIKVSNISNITAAAILMNSNIKYLTD